MIAVLDGDVDSGFGWRMRVKEKENERVRERMEKKVRKRKGKGKKEETKMGEREWKIGFWEERRDLEGVISGCNEMRRKKEEGRKKKSLFLGPKAYWDDILL